jgi:hypothetical protein
MSEYVGHIRRTHELMEGCISLVGCGMVRSPEFRRQCILHHGVSGGPGQPWVESACIVSTDVADMPGFAKMSFQTAPEVPGRGDVRTGRPWTRQCMTRCNGVRKTCIPVHGTKVERIHGPADHYLRSVICRERLSTKRESVTAIYQVHRHETCGIQGTLEQPIRRSRVLGEYRGDRR